MKRKNCYLCKNERCSLLWRKNNFNIVKCNSCGFIYVNRIPSKEYLNKFYKDFDYHNIVEAEKVIRRDAVRSLKKIEQYVPHHRRLLDVGCGRGFFLDEARKRGWETYGIDYSRNVVDYARNVLDLDVKRVDMFTFTSDKNFNVITLNQVVEHLSSPINLIKQCHKLLNLGGILYIATPNISSVSAKVAKENFDYLIPPEHLGFYNNETLSRLLEQNGFKVVYTGSWGYRQDFAGIIKKLLRKREQRVGSIKGRSRNASFKLSLIKRIKYFLFDVFFCGVFYQILHFDHWGANVEIIGIKI